MLIILLINQCERWWQSFNFAQCFYYSNLGSAVLKCSINKGICSSLLVQVKLRRYYTLIGQSIFLKHSEFGITFGFISKVVSIGLHFILFFTYLSITEICSQFFVLSRIFTFFRKFRNGISRDISNTFSKADFDWKIWKRKQMTWLVTKMLQKIQCNRGFKISF